MSGKPRGRIAMTATERQRKWRAKMRRQKVWNENPNRDRSARRTQPRREDLDFFPTPPDLRAAFVEKVLPILPPQLLIWECAAGDGRFGDTITAAGRQVFMSDIEPQRRGIIRLDLIRDAPPPSETRGAVAATNPPFPGSEAGDPFLHRIMALLDEGWLAGAVLLQRADSGGTDKHAEIFNRAVAEVTCCWRPIWIPGTQGGGRWWFAWFVWLAGRSGPPVNIRIRRSHLRTLT